MIVKHGTLLLRAVVIKLHSIQPSSAASTSLRWICSNNYRNTTSKNSLWLQKNECLRKIFLMKQPLRRFTSTKYSKKGEEKFRTKDKIPEDFELIYRAPLNSYVYLAQSVAVVSSLGFISIAAYKIFRGSLMVSVPMDLPGKAGDIYGQIGSDSVEMSIYILAFLLFNALLYGLTMKYALRIYCHKNADAYTCVMNGFLPSLSYKINYCSADVTRSQSLLGKLLPWRDNMFKIGSKTVLLMDNYFRTPADFSLMINDKENV